MSPKIKKILNWTIAIAAGIGALMEEISDQKKDAKMEEMDKRIRLLEESKKGE